MKKLFSLSLALILALTLCVPAFSYSQFEQFHDYERPRVVDASNIISDELEKKLTETYTKWQSNYQTDIVLVTVNSIFGNNIDDYTADYYDFLGYGIGEDYSGIIICICTDPYDRCYSIITTGKEIDRYDQGDIEQIYDAMDPYLKDGEYERAVLVFTGMIGSMMETGSFKNAKKTIVNAFGKDEAKGLNFKLHEKILICFLIALIVGLFSGLVVAITLKNEMKPVKIAVNARNYLTDKSFILRNQTVMYLHSTVSKRAKPKEHDSHSHSGGAGHSGVSHGGGGGRHF